MADDFHVNNSVRKVGVVSFQASGSGLGWSKDDPNLGTTKRVKKRIIKLKAVEETETPSKKRKLSLPKLGKNNNDGG